MSPASPAEGRKAKTEQSRARASEGAPRGEGAFPIKNATEKEGEDWGKAKEKARSQVWGNRKPQRRRGVQGEAKRGGGGQQQQTKDAGQEEADRKRQERIPQQKRKRKRKGETRVGGPWKTWRKSLRAGKGRSRWEVGARAGKLSYLCGPHSELRSLLSSKRKAGLVRISFPCSGHGSTVG